MKIVLELRKKHMRRDGAVTGALEYSGDPDYPFWDPELRNTYTQLGEYLNGEIEYDEDIISLAPGESASSALREQRRYESAKACMASLIFPGSDESGWWTPSLAAQEAVQFADALLAELEK